MPTPTSFDLDLVEVAVERMKRAHHFVQVAFAQFEATGQLDWVEMAGLARGLVTLIPDPGSFTPLRAWGPYESAHAINVTLIAISIGRGLGLSKTTLAELSLAALLHDLGKSIPARHPNRSQLASKATHGEVGHLVLQEVIEIPPRVPEWIRDHHERINGTGPLGRNDPSIEAQCIGIADVYDANVTPHGVRASISPHSAWRGTLVAGQGRFSEAVIEAFKRCTHPYPPGTPVRLTDGSTVVVVSDTSPEDPLAPVVAAGEQHFINLGEYKAPRIIGLAPPLHYRRQQQEAHA